MRPSKFALCLGLLALSIPAFASPGNPDPNAILYNQTGADLLDAHRYDAAVRYLREATTIDTSYEPAHRNLSFALLQTRDIDGAMKEAYTACGLDPTDGYADAYLGQAYAAKGLIAEAVQSAEDGIRAIPGDAQLVCILGVILDNAGMPKDAITQFKYAIRLEPDYAVAHCDLGDAYLHLRRYDDATREFRHAIKLFPHYPYAKQELGVAIGQRTPPPPARPQ